METNHKKNTMPANAKMVFRGKIFEVWQWEQKMYDGTTAIFERLRRPDTTQIIAVVGDTILFQKQEQPHRSASFRSLPGGRVEEGEDSLSGAKRELLEETGYASEDWILWREDCPVAKMDWTIYTYVARNCRKVAEQNLDAGERIENFFIDFEEFLALSDDADFYDRELAAFLYRARFDAAAREKFRGLLFPVIGA